MVRCHAIPANAVRWACINHKAILQGSNHAEINVSNYTGQGGHVTLKAVIEETLSDNAISGSRFSQIRAVLEVIPRDLDVTKTLAGSGGVTYTARRKVCLCTKAPGGWRSENLDFYIIETQERHTMGRDGIVLGKASADRLFLNDTSKHVAPTCLDKGNGGYISKLFVLSPSERSVKRPVS